VLPPELQKLSPKRLTLEDVRAEARKLDNQATIASTEVLPPKTGRRYIVVGGGGFLGGWIISKLLDRGERSDHIRVLDIRPPQNEVVQDALLKGAQFLPVDITKYDSLEAAFTAPWPTPANGKPEPEITVIHTVASIRYYERHLAFMDKSSKVNVDGTRNIVKASVAAGATILICTSSASVGVHNSRILLWPWEKEPTIFRQIVNDDESRLPKHREDFFSNYPYTKRQGERIVREADKTSLPNGKILRTGALRPGNAVFGPRGDLVCDSYTQRGKNESWVHSVLSSFTYVENCATAHLCYEARLLELLNGGTNPDIGGQAFCITDSGPTPTYGDFYTMLEALTDGQTHFPKVSPTFMLFIAYGIETYTRVQHALSTTLGTWVSSVVPPITGVIINLQPPLFSLCNVHVIVDDSRARLPPEKGGLGYTGAWTTLQGAYQAMKEHHARLEKLAVKAA
jgi:nucleoside-diphosphate-sugar epimerase